MVEDGPGIQDRISSMVFTLELDLASNVKANEKFSWLAALFLSAAREAEYWSPDFKDVSLADEK